MQNKPFIILVLWALVLESNFDMEGKDLFPCIPNSSFDSRSNELTTPSWVVWIYDGDELNEILEFYFSFFF